MQTTFESNGWGQDNLKYLFLCTTGVKKSILIPFKFILKSG